MRPTRSSWLSVTAAAALLATCAGLAGPASADPNATPRPTPTATSSATPTPVSVASIDTAASTQGLLAWPVPQQEEEADASLADSVDTPEAETMDEALALYRAAKRAEKEAAELDAQVPIAQQQADTARAQARAATLEAVRTRDASLKATQDVGNIARMAYMSGSMLPAATGVLLAEDTREAIDALTLHDQITSVTSHTVTVADQAKSAASAAATRATEALSAADAADARVTTLKGLAAAKHAEAEEKMQAYRDFLATPGPQAIIGPDGCPISVPETGLRDGSELFGASQLCSESVAQAATPQAALAIKYAFSKIGAPYACGGVGRMEPYRFDCSSLVSRSYWDGAGVPVAGETWAPSTRNMMPWDGVSLDPHYVEVPVDQVRPGDLLLWRSCTQEPCRYQHVTMALANGYMLHTNSCGDIAHVSITPPLTPEANFVIARRVVLLDGEKVAPRVTLEPAVGVGSSEPPVFVNNPMGLTLAVPTPQAPAGAPQPEASPEPTPSS